jgi:hypothetical protein
MLLRAFCVPLFLSGMAGWADDVCFCTPRSQLQNHFAFRILFVIPARLPARQA